MALISKWFRANRRLQSCLISDPAHVKKGDQGDHVKLIQGALAILEGPGIDIDEQQSGTYDESTADAVLEFKRRRNIINFSYQTKADNIVGRMTIKALDAEMFRTENLVFRPMLSFAISATPTMVILSEPAVHAQLWAKQVASANPNTQVNQAPGNGTVEQNVAAIKKAISDANGGLLIFNVGHGFCLQSNFRPNTQEGAFDIAPNSVMRIEGKNMENDPSQFVNVFYDDKPPPAPGGGVVPKSDRQLDAEAGRNVDKRKRFDIYEDLSKSFKAGQLAGVLLATCRVGRATGLLQKVAEQWNTPIIAYRDQWMFFEAPNRNTRAILAADKGQDGVRTKTPFGEIFFPLSLFEMVQLRP
jgi:hypothetical protein